MTTILPFSPYEIRSTPALVYDLNEIRNRCSFLLKMKRETNCTVLYSIKALPLRHVLEEMHELDGFSVASLFEARLGHNRFNQNSKRIHLVTPGIKPTQWKELHRYTTDLTFNSLEQLDLYKSALYEDHTYGIRVNPGVPLLGNPAYATCTASSKLGVPLLELRKRLESDPSFFDDVDGLHFHVFFECVRFNELLLILRTIDTQIGRHLNRFKWINIGGGLNFSEIGIPEVLFGYIQELQDRFNLNTI